jgi:serine/threonine protein kinase
MSNPQQSAKQQPTTTFYERGGFVPPSPQELAARLPNLEVLELLGQGGMGVVYKGRQPFLDRQVAIKLIRPDFGTSQDSEEPTGAYSSRKSPSPSTDLRCSTISSRGRKPSVQTPSGPALCRLRARRASCTRRLILPFTPSIHHEWLRKGFFRGAAGHTALPQGRNFAFSY